MTARGLRGLWPAAAARDPQLYKALCEVMWDPRFAGHRLLALVVKVGLSIAGGLLSALLGRVAGDALDAHVASGQAVSSSSAIQGMLDSAAGSSSCFRPTTSSAAVSIGDRESMIEADVQAAYGDKLVDARGSAVSAIARASQRLTAAKGFEPQGMRAITLKPAGTSFRNRCGLRDAARRDEPSEAAHNE